jgi:NAD(P)-dependent dehydrogenase (short-subunit alcohol dehydrogenase family)
MDQSISGKVVVITGASSGAGRAMAIEFAKEGASLVLAARREEALQEVVTECNELGGDAVAIVTDTREMESVRDLANAAFRFGGVIDIWINNAGVLAAGALDEVPADVSENVIRTNLLGYMNGARAVLPFFKAQGYGLLINNISVGGWFPTPFASAYTASKFGLRGFSESLKGELSDFPAIHVCDLYPGFLDTPGMQHAANFTGRALKPAPPVFDPRSIARTVLRLARHPRSIAGRDAVSLFLKWAYLLFPGISRRVTATVIKNYLKQADAMACTSGNVLNPVAYGRGIDGGWRNVRGPLPTRSFLLIGLAAGIILLTRKI